MPVIEAAFLSVRGGETTAFEAAFAKAKPLIAASPGFRSIALHPPTGDGNENGYLLLVEWDSIAAHRDGFRRSDRYQQWMALLHGFYDPMPTIRYFGETL